MEQFLFYQEITRYIILWCQVFGNYLGQLLRLNGNCLKSLFYKLCLFVFASHCGNGRLKTTADLMKCPWNMRADHSLSVSVIWQILNRCAGRLWMERLCKIKYLVLYYKIRQSLYIRSRAYFGNYCKQRLVRKWYLCWHCNSGHEGPHPTIYRASFFTFCHEQWLSTFVYAWFRVLRCYESCVESNESRVDHSVDLFQW